MFLTSLSDLMTLQRTPWLPFFVVNVSAGFHSLLANPNVMYWFLHQPDRVSAAVTDYICIDQDNLSSRQMCKSCRTNLTVVSQKMAAGDIDLSLRAKLGHKFDEFKSYCNCVVIMWIAFWYSTVVWKLLLYMLLFYVCFISTYCPAL